MAQPININEILQRAFPGLQEKEAFELEREGKVVTFSQGVTICQEGALEQTFYIILEGEVEVSKHIADEDIRVMTTLKVGDTFGEMAIIQKEPRSATITALSPLKTLEYGPDTFARMLESSMSMSLALIRKASNRLRENDTLAINELRKKNEELAAAYDRLARQEHARHEFLTTIAHELRTPLMTASGFLQVIRMGSMQGEALESAMQTVARNVQQIITLTNDILFVQEMDLILPENKPTDIGAVVAAAVESQRSKAESSQIGLSLEIASRLPMILGDAQGLERAFTVILDNAIKFSPLGGEVQVIVSHKGEEIMVTTRDHGVGIPPDALPHIFERFYHTDQIGEHIFGGAGLGLSIAEKVIEQHQGRIDVQSKLGEGSTFTIVLKNIM